MFLFLFFFKQKTAYEMRISDWSSDVCSSDLSEARLAVARGQLETALAQLDTSLENYLRFVGLPARDLEQPPALSGLPGTPAQAVAIAVENNQLGRASGRERVCQ